MALTASDFRFTLTEGDMQERNPGFGVWLTTDKQTAIIQTGLTNGRRTTFIPCRRNESGTLQGGDGCSSVKSFDHALERLSVVDSVEESVIPSGYMRASAGEVVLVADWDAFEEVL
jgi:hypothetical protein